MSWFDEEDDAVLNDRDLLVERKFVSRKVEAITIERVGKYHYRIYHYHKISFYGAIKLKHYTGNSIKFKCKFSTGVQKFFIWFTY